MATPGLIAGTVWEAVPDDVGDIYYYNTATQDTTWTKPEEVVAAEAAQAAESLPRTDVLSAADEAESVEKEATTDAADIAAEDRAIKAKQGTDAAEDDATADPADIAAQIRARKAKKAGGDAAEDDATADPADIAAQIRARKAKKAGGDAAEDDATADPADIAAQIRARKAKKAGGDAAEDDTTGDAADIAVEERAMKAKQVDDISQEAPADAADIAAQIRARKAKKAGGDAAEEEAPADSADTAAQMRAMKAKKAGGDAADDRTQVADRAVVGHKVAANKIATETVPGHALRVQAVRDDEAAVGAQRMPSSSGLLTPARPASTGSLGTPQSSWSHTYSLYDAQPQNVHAYASTRRASSAAIEAAIAAEVKAESRRHDERSLAWSRGSRLGLPPAGESPMPAASPTAMFHSPSRMASHWADPELLQTARVQDMNQHLTSASALDSSRVSRGASQAESPDALQRLTQVQTENTVLRDRLLLAEGALESLRIHGEQERCAREAMHATLVASEHSRAELREELVLSRGVQRELEAEVAELRRQVGELTLLQNFGQAR